MYRKKLMKVALSSIMAATVIVSGVPVYAVDAPAVQQEEAKGEDVVVLYFADGVKIGQELLSGVKDHKFNITELKHIPEGYETVLTGDIAVQDGVAKVELKKEAEKPVVKNRNVYVKFETEDGKLLDAATVVTIGGKDTVFNASKVKVPEGYELCETGDVYVALDADAVTLKVREIAVADRNVWVKFETEDGKLLDAATVVTIGGKDTVFNTSKVKVPEGYELCEVGDVYVSLEDDAVTLKVREVAVPDRTVWVKFETEDGKLLDAATVVKLGGKDTVFNTSKVKVPEGYELCEVGDVYVSLEDDAVTLKVREVVVPDRTVWVKFETEDGKLLDAATVVKLGGKDTVFNTSKVKVPEGYELCEVGDVYVSLEDDAVTLKVRKVDVPVEPEKPEDPQKPVEPQKPEEPQKPAKPNTTDKEDNKKDDKKKDDKKKEDKKKSPKTGDEVDPFAAALPAGVSLAAILAMLSKKYK